MTLDRGSGVFLHVTSLPGRGRGTLGAPARAFVDWLSRAGASWWQVCPLGPTASAHADSPYAAYSAFAGNPLLVDLDELVGAGLLPPSSPGDPGFDDAAVEYERVGPYVEERLRTAFDRFEAGSGGAEGVEGADLEGLRSGFEAFREREGWLGDYALFRALKADFDGAPWWEWPRPVRERDPSALDARREALAEEVRYREFRQFLFDRQWRDLRAYANDRGVAVLGDVPIYVALDSADAWANPAAFQLDDAHRPTAVAGVPPTGGDDGQRWGNPLYDWDHLRATDFEWWVRRFERTLDLVDRARIDHFRGFDEYWAIPADAADPGAGEWRSAPGGALFERVRDALGELPFVAEDLGHLTPSVHDLRDRFGLPGMRVVHYADWTDPDDRYRPGNYPDDVVGYTGTHDTDTVVGWYRDLPDRQRRALQDRLGIDGEVAGQSDGDGRDGIHWAVLDAVWASDAVLAMAPLQDVLGLGTGARFNTPGTVEGNWRWRVTREALSDDRADRLRRITERHGRA